MPKIVVNAFLALDGVMQAPGGPDGYSRSGHGSRSKRPSSRMPAAFSPAATSSGARK